ncbi:MAG: tRNA glutamyl-Q(34) synthetase GluQRS [Rhodospirillaceae bacterium]
MPEHSSRPYRGRYAPSPTGPLHFGSVVAAVASYAEAKAQGGAWLLRIDDLDAPRIMPGATSQILATLEALGMAWDGEVVYQSARSDAYHAALHELRAQGRVYACRCSRREIADSSIRGVEGYVYPGTCRNGLDSRARAWRYDTRGQVITFDDAVQGKVVQDIEREVGDFVLYRADGIYAYHLAVAVDDAEQGVTHIVRGADLLVSTPRQIVLQQALRLPHPHYAHVPVAIDAYGEKLSKQTRAAPVTATNAPRALRAALRFLGQALPPDADGMSCAALLQWAIHHWSLARVPRTATRRLDMD